MNAPLKKGGAFLNRKTYKINKKLSWIYLCNSDDSNVQATIHDITHGNNLRFNDVAFNRHNGLWNCKLNLLKEIQTGVKSADKHVNEIIKYLKFHHYMLQNADNVQLYSGLLTFSNCHYENGVIKTPTGQNPYKLIRYLNRKLKNRFKNNSDKFVIASGIENAIFKGLIEHRRNFYNVHEHLIIGVIGHKLPITSRAFTNMNELSNYLSNYSKDKISFSMRPLMNKATNEPIIIDNYTSNSDYRSIEASCLYLYKQNKLPIAKNWRDYYTFRHLKPKYQYNIVHSILKTIPNRMRLHSCLNFKPRAEKLENIVMDSIKSEMIMLKNFVRSNSKSITTKSEFLLNLLLSVNSVNIVINFSLYHDNSPP